MQTTHSRISPELIVSSRQFEKDGHVYYAGLDPSTATVRVLSGLPVNAHGLKEHFERTSSKSSHDVTTLIHTSLARANVDEPRGSDTRIFVFMPTSRCNMGCSYCGQTHGGGSVHSTVLSGFLARVQHAFLATRIRHVHIAWFGGEPLLAYRSIVELSSQIVEMAQASGRRYSSKLTTNGALLTASRMRVLIEDAHVQRFDITLDGPPAIHNRHRPLNSGGASFDKIVNTLAWFRDADLRKSAVVVLRTNIDKENLRYIGDYLRIMKALGFDDGKKFLFEMAPIHSWGNDVSAIALTTKEAARHEVEWMELMEDLGLRYDLLPGRPAEKTCVATDPDSEVIDSRGNLFSCTETPLTIQAGTDVLGNIISLPTLDRRPQGQFAGWDHAVAGGGIPCSSCQLRTVCRGACPKQWSEGTVPCPTLKLNFDDRMAIFMRRYGYRTTDAT
jgi:uncharacterized protein